ncbi:DUF6300 family protein [Streptomyces sp. NPDC102487]|uniref:DUF6300 family protein n=1 Tax=Streptomyces sp. NPDC102487 TaxID=3366182 RepID=UPI0038287E1C
MTGVWMDLCPACDAHNPAARAFIHWYRDPDRGPKALPQLLENWEPETMHIHGGRVPRRTAMVAGKTADFPGC